MTDFDEAVRAQRGPRLANVDFFANAEAALHDLFHAARQKNELMFAFALMPEFRGLMDGGWNTARESEVAFRQYLTLLDQIPRSDPVSARIALSLYLQLAEGAGYYEVPKKLLLVLEDKGNNTVPFADLVKTHSVTGAAIAPNANLIMKALAGHAASLKLDQLSGVFRDAFDADVRNAVAHADYVIASDGLRMPRRNGGQVRKIPWPEFTDLMDRAINFYQLILDVREEHILSYNPPRVVRGRLLDEPETNWVIYYNPRGKNFGFTSAPLQDVLAEFEGTEGEGNEG